MKASMSVKFQIWYDDTGEDSDGLGMMEIRWYVDFRKGR